MGAVANQHAPSSWVLLLSRMWPASRFPGNQNTNTLPRSCAPFCCRRAQRYTGQLPLQMSACMNIASKGRCWHNTVRCEVLCWQLHASRVASSVTHAPASSLSLCRHADLHGGSAHQASTGADRFRHSIVQHDVHLWQLHARGHTDRDCGSICAPVTGTSLPGHCG
jgi:hypothetical protein